MESYLESIKNKIKNKNDIEEVDIVDNSKAHIGHKSYDEKKFHLQIKIKSNFLNSLNRINAHKKIMEILKEDLKTKIHALEISIQ